MKYSKCFWAFELQMADTEPQKKGKVAVFFFFKGSKHAMEITVKSLLCHSRNLLSGHWPASSIFHWLWPSSLRSYLKLRRSQPLHRSLSSVETEHPQYFAGWGFSVLNTWVIAIIHRYFTRVNALGGAWGNFAFYTCHQTGIDPN